MRIGIGTQLEWHYVYTHTSIEYVNEKKKTEERSDTSPNTQRNNDF